MVERLQNFTIKVEISTNKGDVVETFDSVKDFLEWARAFEIEGEPLYPDEAFQDLARQRDEALAAFQDLARQHDEAHAAYSESAAKKLADDLAASGRRVAQLEAQKSALEGERAFAAAEIKRLADDLKKAHTVSGKGFK